ncbi:hypothetical protein QL285_026612 [Trifolium repens]|nr:hypothetical protein QL285_026612 [Trifolium repens]
MKSKKKTIANARRSYGTYENSTVKSTVSAAIKTQLCSLPPTNQSPLLSFSSTEECFRRFSQQSYLQSTRVLDAVIVVKLMLANSLFPEVWCVLLCGSVLATLVLSLLRSFIKLACGSLKFNTDVMPS